MTPPPGRRIPTADLHLLISIFRPSSPATARFRPLTAKAQAQLEKELGMIEKLALAGYFAPRQAHPLALEPVPGVRDSTGAAAYLAGVSTG